MILLAKKTNKTVDVSSFSYIGFIKNVNRFYYFIGVTNMPRTENQQLKLLCLRDYLLENSDIMHPVKARDIIAHLKSKGLSSERKSFYRNIELLNDYYREDGMDYIEYNVSKQGYCIAEREFELQELQLIIDGVQSSKFITQKMADNIIGKLKKLANRHERPLLDRHSYVTNRIRSMSDSAFLNINDIHESIANNNKIEFKYFSYDIKKKKKYNKKRYIVSPFALQWSESNYYLIGYESGKIRHFRVDKIDRIEVLWEDKRDREGIKAFESINLSERATKMFSMFHGKEERVKLRFSNHLVGAVLERFGHDISLIKDEDDHFAVYVNVEISPHFWGWLVGFGGSVKILSPESVIDEFSKYVLKIFQMYKVDERARNS